MSKKPEEIYQRKIPEEMSGKSEIMNMYMEKTRTHSSRMCTDRLLTVSQGGVPVGGYLPRCPPCEHNDRQVQKYYLAPNFVCGR